MSILKDFLKGIWPILHSVSVWVLDLSMGLNLTSYLVLNVHATQLKFRSSFIIVASLKWLHGYTASLIIRTVAMRYSLYVSQVCFKRP